MIARIDEPLVLLQKRTILLQWIDPDSYTPLVRLATTTDILYISTNENPIDPTKFPRSRFWRTIDMGI